MSFIKTTIRLLKELNRLWVVAIGLFITLACIVTMIIECDLIFAFPAIYLMIMLSWEISDVYQHKQMEILKAKAADLSDELCIALHESERLRMDLDTYKAAQAGAMPSTEGKAESRVPKRRPAFKKKAKPKTETKHEETKDLD